MLNCPSDKSENSQWNYIVDRRLYRNTFGYWISDENDNYFIGMNLKSSMFELVFSLSLYKFVRGERLN